MKKRRKLEPELSPEDQAKALDVNLTLCFLCQEKPPTHQATSTNGTFMLCESCAQACDAQARSMERVAQALVRNDRLNVFTYTLGLPTVVRHPFKITKIK